MVTVLGILAVGMTLVIELQRDLGKLPQTKPMDKNRMNR
jgi:hypothetical protein